MASSLENSGDYIKKAELDLNSYDHELSNLRDQQLSLLKGQRKSENRPIDGGRIHAQKVLPHGKIYLI